MLVLAPSGEVIRPDGPKERVAVPLPPPPPPVTTAATPRGTEEHWAPAAAPVSSDLSLGLNQQNVRVAALRPFLADRGAEF